MAHVLLITGAGRGIGAATARLAAARGYDVGVTYKSDATSAADVVAAVKAKGRNAVAIAADMGREADVERMFKEADALGRLTHFVYNAGIPGVAGRLESADSAMMREVIEVNVLGALWSMQHAIRRMSKKHGGAGGAIVLLSSVAADIGGPNEYVWYAASKGAVESITYGLSKELAGRRHPGQLRVARRERDAHPCRRRHAGQARPRRADDPDGPRRPARGKRRSGAVSSLRRRLLHQRHGAARRRRALAHCLRVSVLCLASLPIRPYDHARRPACGCRCASKRE